MTKEQTDNQSTPEVSSKKTKIAVVIISLLLLIGFVVFVNRQYAIDMAAAEPATFEERIETAKAINTDLMSKYLTDSSANTVSENETNAETVEKVSFFDQYRNERDVSRSKEVELWHEIIISEEAKETFKVMAQEEINKILALTEKEMIVESIIKMRGYKDSLIFITEDAATVIVDAKELTLENVSEISEIVVKKTKLEPSAIKIMIKN